MPKYIKVICHLAEGVTLLDLVEAVNDIWGTANLEADSIEKYLPQVNTPVQNDYISIRMPEEHAYSLQYFVDNFPESSDTLSDFWRIEWPYDEEGNPITYDPISWEEEVPVFDPETGEPTGETRTEIKYLGGFA